MNMCVTVMYNNAKICTISSRELMLFPFCWSSFVQCVQEALCQIYHDTLVR
jgi:hypothetical protein